jgi:DNA repair protein RadD
MKTPRPYQEACLIALFRDLVETKDDLLVVAPVGAGKSLIIAELVRRMHEKWGAVKVAQLAHVKELLVQNCEEMREQYPTADIGFYCAKLGQKVLHRDVTFASIQSIKGKAHRTNRAFDLIIIDECHLISHKDDTMYRKFIADCKEINPKCRVVGLTGTPFRSDSGRLDEGENALFQRVSYEIPIRFMIDEGYWVKPTTKNNKIIDASLVKTRGGDYIEKDLQNLVDDPDKVKACVDQILLNGELRNKALIFTAGVKHSHDVCDEFKRRGEAAEVVTGDTPDDERDEIIARYKSGEFKYLVNVAVLTTGFNVPDIDMIVFLRPMKSPVLYIQCLGRGVRVVYAPNHDLSTKEGRLQAIANSTKLDCFVLDLAGVVENLGPVDQIEIRKSYTGEKEFDGIGQAPVKMCPSCSAECATSQKYCFECGYSFLAASLSTQQTDAIILKQDYEPQEFKVDDVYYSIHTKKGAPLDAPKSLKVTYITEMGPFHEFVCFEHHKYDAGDRKRFAWNKAVAFFKERIIDETLPVPKTCEDALAISDQFLKPDYIVTKHDGKYYSVIKAYLPEKPIETYKDEEPYYEIPF